MPDINDVPPKSQARFLSDPKILIAFTRVDISVPSWYEALYSPMIVAAGWLGPWPRSDNPLQATYTLGTLTLVINFLANPRSLLDVIYIDWLVFESAWSVVISFYHPVSSPWHGGGAMNGLSTLPCIHFLLEGMHKNLTLLIKFLANPRSMLDVIYWLVGISVLWML